MQENIVFIVGSGASKEVNLPTGEELKSTISRYLNIRFDFSSQKSGDYEITEAVKKIAGDNGENPNSYFPVARHISEALPLDSSIDNFIDSHRGNEKIEICGKLAIVKAILEAEKRSLLRTDKAGKLVLSFLNDTWYIPFYYLLTQNCDIDKLKERLKLITLVIFNYDRCIEHFICLSLQLYYGINQNSAADLVRCINIYHPYGVVGTLPWFNPKRAIDFGGDVHAIKLIELASKIKTFTEGTEPESSEITEIRGHVDAANKVVFLGFAFHKLNMKLITPVEPVKNHSVRAFATTLGISDTDKEVIQSQIAALYKRKIRVDMVNSNCCHFFTEFKMSLSF